VEAGELGHQDRVHCGPFLGGSQQRAPVCRPTTVSVSGPSRETRRHPCQSLVIALSAPVSGMAVILRVWFMA
jgi:hypothetical protein